MVYTRKNYNKITRRKCISRRKRISRRKHISRRQRISRRKHISRRQRISRRKHISRIKRTSRIIKKYNKKGGSVIYSVDDNDTQYSDDTYEGQSFFRKVYPENKFIKIGRDTYPIGEANEKQIIEILMKHPQHPNIVKFFFIHNNAIDMEELETYATVEDYGDKNFTKINKKQQVENMRKAKDFLQGLGIMYMDWKFDNIGREKGINKDTYKLFDFDSSGLINTETDEWILKPLHIKSYNIANINAYKHRIGTADKPITPKEMDDWSFEYNILDQVNRM